MIPTERGAERQRIAAQARRVVVKLGTAILTREDGSGIALSRLPSFVETIAAWRAAGREVLLVSSGAVGLGAARVGSGQPAQSLPQKQAFAAVGQGRLMALYTDAFDRLGIPAAQVLLTEGDFHNRQRYLNLRGTLHELLRLGAVPVINENDTVSTAELEPYEGAVIADAGVGSRKVNFGDNDKLSALVASKMDADLLVILTDVDGLYDADPRSTDAPAPRLISTVAEITPDIMALAGGAGGRVGRGGMRTKLDAARVATQSGCAVIIAPGRLPQALDRLIAGESIGTLFLPAIEGPSQRRRWIAFATTVDAAMVVNEGARRAVVEGKGSLLPAGLVAVRGRFDRGDVVSILDEKGDEFARGLVNYSSDDTAKVLGKSSEALDQLAAGRNYDALVTRDNLALLSQGIFPVRREDS